MIKTSKLLPRLLPCLALFYPVAVQAADIARPNIILMISDDHRWDCVGASGNPNIHTPNMDRLAHEGVYFKEATIANPQCTCSRAVLLTGLATHANGRYSNQTARKDIIDPHGFDQYHCLPEVLAEQGYHTAFVGKWHCSADPWNVGFQEIGTWMPQGAGPYYEAKLARGKSRDVSTHDGFTQQIFGESAREVLQHHADGNSSEPLFLWLAMTAPHSPFQPNPQAATDPYKGKEIKDVLPPTYEGDWDSGRPEKWLDYVAAITSVDNELGAVMKTLDETGMSSNTVIVFLGDNGYMMGNRGRQGKVVPYEDSIRVPMMVWGPGVIDAKGVTRAVASSLDLPPTIVSLTGAAPPKEWHGRDLSKVLDDGGVHGTTWSVTEAPDYQNWKFPGVCYRTVRTTDSKLIVWHKSTGKAPEFYDTSVDPEEKNNLYAEAAMKPRVDALEGVLESWMTATGDNWQMKGQLEQVGKPSKKKKAGKGKRARKAAGDK